MLEKVRLLAFGEMNMHRTGSVRALWTVRNGAFRLLGFAFFFSIFVNLLMLTGPLFMLQVYDRVLGSRSEETLATLLVLVAILYGLMWLLDLSRTALLARIGARLQSGLDRRVFCAVLINKARQSRPASATRDLEVIQSTCASPALTALMDVPFTPAFIAIIFVLHPSLGLLALAGGSVLVALACTNQIATYRRIGRAHMASSEAHGFSESAGQRAELIRSQAMVDTIADRWMELRNASLIQAMRASDWNSGLSTLTKSFRLFLQSLILALGAWLVLQGQLTPGAMIASSILLGRALTPLEQLLSRWPQLVQARQSWVSLAGLLETTGSPANPTKLPQPSSQLIAKGLTISGGPGTPPILYNVSFTIGPGEALGVIGRSGSGKTTIAKALLNQARLTVGEVRLGGASLSQYCPNARGTYIGYLPQEAQLLSGSIAENIGRMAQNPDSQLVVAAARKALAHKMILTLPNGYDTQIDDPKIGLSGGQRQRIALARALFGDPVLLVLDEPNSALDQEGTEALNAAIRAMKSEGRSAVVMTHRPMAISECDNLLVLEAGSVKAIGPRDSVLKAMMKNAGDIRQAFANGGHS